MPSNTGCAKIVMLFNKDWITSVSKWKRQKMLKFMFCMGVPSSNYGRSSRNSFSGERVNM